MATSVVRFAKEFAKEAAYDQVANHIFDRATGTATGKPTLGGAAYDGVKAHYVPGIGQGKQRRYRHIGPTPGEQIANRRLQAQQWKQEQSLGRQRGTDAMNQMNHSVAFHYVKENPVYQDCCSVAIPAPQQETFMTNLEKMAIRPSAE